MTDTSPPPEVERARERANILANVLSRSAELAELLLRLRRHGDVLTEDDRRLCATLIVSQCRTECVALLGVDGALRVNGLAKLDDLLPHDGVGMPVAFRELSGALRDSAAVERAAGLEVSPSILESRRRAERAWTILQRSIGF
jgi:hypothetical protein